MISTLEVDDLRYEIRWSTRRKTLQITVDRSGELILSAPKGCDVSRLAAFARETRFWVYTKLARKEALWRSMPRKEFVSGEGFPYLGCYYRLLLTDEQDQPLKLEHGRFKLLRSEASQGRTHFVRWYTAHAESWLNRRIGGLAARIGVEPTRVAIRDLGFRWGSCGKRGIVHFHWATILLPPRVIEYIAIHELVHLCEPHHTPSFWRRVERILPDHESRKQWLAEHGMRHIVL